MAPEFHSARAGKMKNVLGPSFSNKGVFETREIIHFILRQHRPTGERRQLVVFKTWSSHPSLNVWRVEWIEFLHLEPLAPRRSRWPWEEGPGTKGTRVTCQLSHSLETIPPVTPTVDSDILWNEQLRSCLSYVGQGHGVHGGITAKKWV